MTERTVEPLSDVLAILNAAPGAYLVLLPDAPNFTIVAVTDAYLMATSTRRKEMIGHGIVEIFSDIFELKSTFAITDLRASLKEVLEKKVSNYFPFERQSLVTIGSGGSPKVWKSINKPVLNSDGDVQYIIHSIDVIEKIDKIENLNEELAQQATKKYLELFQSIDQGFCTITVKYNEEDRPVDYQFIEVSPSFEHQTGIKDAAGKWMREIAADQDEFWFETYGRIAKDRKSERFEYFSTPLNRWWSVYAFPIDEPKQRQIGILFDDITEQIKTKKKIEESEKQFRNVLLQSPNIFVILEGFPEMIITFANEPLFKSWGKTAEIIGKPLLEVLPEIKDQPFPKLMQGVFETGETYFSSEEKAVIIKNGVPVDTYYVYVYQAIVDDDQKVTGVTIMATDITEQVTARRKIEESEKRFSNLLLESPFAVAILKGKDMVVALANDAIKRIWGKGNEIEDKPLLSFMPEIQEQGFASLLEKVYTTGKPFYGHEELVKLQRNGIWEEVYFNFIYQPYKEADETISGVTIIANEVTTQAIANKKIEESKSQLQNVFLNAPAALCIVEGKENKYILANKAYEKLTNRKAEDLIGKSNREVFPELIGTGTFELFDKVFETGETFVDPEYAATLDLNNEGVLRQCYFNFSMEPLKNDLGEIYAVMALTYDITEQVLARQKNVENEKQKDYLLKLSDALRPLADPVEIQSVSSRLLGKHLQLDRCGYAYIHADDENATVLRDYHVPDFASFTGTYQMEAFGPGILATMRRGDTLMVSDIFEDPANADPVTSASYAANAIRSFIATPLVKEGHLVAILFAHHRTPRRWTASDIAVVEETAERTWAAVERTKAQDALQQSEKKYRGLYDSMEEGILTIEIIFDQNNKAVNYLFLDTNPAITKISGLSRDIIGKTVNEVLPNIESFWLDAFGQVVKTGEPARLEYFLKDLNNNWFEVHASKVGDKDSRNVVCVYRNITDRKHSEANLAFLADVSLDLVQLTNMEDLMNLLGEKIAAHFNVPHVSFSEIDEPEEIATITHDWHRDDLSSMKGPYRLRDYHTEEFQQTLRCGKTYIVRDASNDPRTNALAAGFVNSGSFACVPLLNNGYWLFLLSIMDVEAHDWRKDEIELLEELTGRIWARLEKVKAEEAIKKSEEKFRTLFNSIDEGVVTIELIFDENGKALDWIYLEHNPSLERQTGMTDVVGKRASELFMDLEPHWLDTHERIVRTGKHERHEYYMSEINTWFDTYFSKVGGEESHKIICVYNNITARKNEEEKKEYLLKLTDALKELTDPIEVQLTACKILGEHVKVNRVLYAEVIDEKQVVMSNNYANGVPPINVTLDAEQFGRNLIDAFKRNEKVIFSDITTDSEYSEDAKRSFLSLNVVANVSMGLLKGGRWVAAFGMHYNAPRKWTETEIWLLEETAERTWAAVERARAEEALRKSEDKYLNELQSEVLQRTSELKENQDLLQTVFDASPNSISVYEILYNEQGDVYDFKIIIFNAFTLRTIGGRDVIGQKYSEAFPHAVESGILEEFIKVATTGEQIEFEKLYVGEGMRHWFRFIASKIDKRLLVTTEDITERKKADNEIKTNLTLLKQSEDLSQIGSWEYDIATSNFTWSEGMYRLFNIPKGMPVKPEIYLDYAVDEDLYKAERILGSFKKPQSFEETLSLNKNGIVRELKIKASIVNDEKGTPQKLVGVDLDITEVKQSEKTLKEQAHFIHSTNQAMPDILFVLNLSTKDFIYINHSFEERLGYNVETEAFRSKNIFHLLYEEDFPAMLTHLEEMKTIADEVVCEIEYRLKAADGSLHWFRDRNSVFRRDEQGVAIETISIAQDVTARKKSDLELKESNTSLRYANENLQQFASIAAHDLQEPLRKLKMFASVLKRYDDKLPEEAKEVIQKISLTSGRMRQLISEVLQYSKVAYGSKEFVPTNLHHILQNVLSDLDLMLADTEAHIEYDEKLPEINAIPLQMNQLFYNLLTNALKFRKDDLKPILNISYRTLPPAEVKNYAELNADRSYIEILFSDNGVGFDQMYAGQIFEIFERLYSVDEYEGTGVGLALCKKIAENHNGHIFARSTEGEGAKFYILLPITLKNKPKNK